MHFNSLKKRVVLVISIFILVWIGICIWLYSLPQKSQDWLIHPIQGLINLPGGVILALCALVSLLFIIVATGALSLLVPYIKTGSFKPEVK